MKKGYRLFTSAFAACRDLGVCGFFLFAASNIALAQQNTVFLPYLGQGYRFQAVKSNSVPQNFQSPTYNDSGWLTANAAVGTLNNTSSPPCPLNDATHVQTQWPSSRDVLLRKHITLPAGTRNLKVSVAIDNAVQVFLNGTDISGGIQIHNDCAAPGNFVFNVPDNLLISGDNVLAVHGVWLSAKNYLDVQVAGDVPYTITASAGTNGTISPSGAVLVYQGASQAFSISPAVGYHIANVLVDGVSQGAISSYTFTNVTSNHTISASFAITTYTITPTAGANGTIAPSTAVTVNYGGSAAFSVTPGTGYHVDSLLVDGIKVDSTSSYTFTSVSANHTIRAVFAINKYTLTPTAGSNGTITPSTTMTVNYGGGAVFGVTPGTGYHVDSLLVDGVKVDSTTSYTFTNVTANHTIRAVFAINKYTLTPAAGPNGAITPSTTVTVNYGGSAVFGITPSAGYHVDSLVVDGVKVDSTTSYTFTSVSANHTIRAVFAINQYVITASAGPNGTISPSGSVNVTYGASQGFAISPAAHYHIDTVFVDGVRVASTTSYTFINVTANHTIRAVFAIDTYTITASAGANGSISPVGTVTVNYGTNPTFTATPNANYHVDSLFVDGAYVGPLTSYTFVNVSANHTIAATFSVNSFVVTNTLDGRTGSLRDVILSANAHQGPDTIRFNIPVSGVQTISPASALPAITETALVDATSQPGYTGTPLIELNGSGAGQGVNGLTINASNSSVRGIMVDHFSGAGIVLSGSGNSIGGTASGFRNVIAFNGGAGVVVTRGNGQIPSAGNAILSNSIYSNGALGIDLGGNGVTPNLVPKSPTPLPYPTTPDSINNAQNYPFLYIALPESSIVRGSVVSWPNTLLHIELFRNSSVDQSGFGQGEEFVGSTTVRTDALGNATFSLSPGVTLQLGQYLAATATDTANNTSEFSPDLLVGGKSKIYGNHYVVNTTLSGIPLHWSDGKAIYNISATVPSNFGPAIDSSFATWSRLPQVKYSSGGPTVSGHWGGLPDGINNLVWMPNHWVDSTGSDTNAIAVTRVRYNSLNGEMTDVDIAVNAQYFQFDIVNAPSTTVEDVQNIATHEIGHFGGLGDIYNPGVPPYLPFMGAANDTVTMFGLIKKGETSKRSLHSPDTAGIGYIYSHLPDYRVDMMLVFDGTGNFASTTAYDGLIHSQNSAIQLVQELRVGDRIGVVQLPSTVIQPITLIQDSASRAQVAAAIASIVAGGTCDIRQGLVTGQNQLTGAQPLPNHGRAMILFSAGEETVLPTALTAVPGLRSSGVPVFTMGFAAGVSGQDLDSRLADSTGGAYYLAADTIINKIVNSIWNIVTGLQLTADTVIASNSAGLSYQGGLSWQGQNGLSWQGQNGLSWQGGVDPGTTSIQPGLSWQGGGSTTSAISGTGGGTGTTQVAMAKSAPGLLTPVASSQLSRYILGLVDPNNIRIDSTNFTSYPGALYVQGPTFNYFKIDHPVPGKWTLWVFGDNSTSSGPHEPLYLSLTTFTDVTMDVTFNESNYVIGDQVTVQATLSQGGQAPNDEHTTGGGPITDANVQADVILPGTTTLQTITLIHTGSGIYSGSFNNTSTVGSYRFTVRAQGTIPGTQVTFSRQHQQSVFVAPPFVANAVVFATNSATIQDSSQINSGSVIVNNVGTGTSLNSSVDLFVGTGVTTPQRYTLKASRIAVLAGAAIGGDVYYNTLTNAGAISGALHTPLALPVVATLPTFESASIGTTNINLGNGQSSTLSPGSYNNVKLSPQSTLTLSAGVYNFSTLWVKSGAKLLFTGASKVRVLLGYSSENGSYVGPANGSTIDASNVVFFVGGADSQSPFSKAVIVGPHATIYANVYAPNGTVWLNDTTTATGAFLAKDALVGKKVLVTLSTSFAGLSKGTGASWAQEPGAPSSAPDVPRTYAIEQNYPNPFNPVTTIRYQLPEDKSVRLDVYNILGQLVRTLVDEPQVAGFYSVNWDGTNAQGSPVGSGPYFYRLQAGDFVQNRKMLLLK